MNRSCDLQDFFTQDERVSGALIFHILLIIYLCNVMGTVCDRYFIPSLEIMSDG